MVLTFQILKSNFLNNFLIRVGVIVFELSQMIQTLYSLLVHVYHGNIVRQLLLIDYMCLNFNFFSINFDLFKIVLFHVALIFKKTFGVDLRFNYSRSPLILYSISLNMGFSHITSKRFSCHKIIRISFCIKFYFGR